MLLCFRFASGGRWQIAAADVRDLRQFGEASYIHRLEHNKTQQACVIANSTPDKPVLDRAAPTLDVSSHASCVFPQPLHQGPEREMPSARL